MTRSSGNAGARIAARIARVVALTMPALGELFGLGARAVRLHQAAWFLVPKRPRVVGFIHSGRGTLRRLPLTTTKREVAEQKRALKRERKRLHLPAAIAFDEERREEALKARAA